MESVQVQQFSQTRMLLPNARFNDSTTIRKHFLSSESIIVVTENPTRHIDFLREMEALKRNHQIRCSHYELEFSVTGKAISCAICGKSWSFLETRGFSDIRQVYRADKH